MKPNKVSGRGDVVQSESNNPCEDTFNSVEMSKKFNGMYFAVFDGHVGWQVSKAC